MAAIQVVKSFVNILTPGQGTKVTKQVDKFTLMNAVFSLTPISIHTEAGVFDITINNFSPEDGSAQSWCFKGFTSKHKVVCWVRTDRAAGSVKRPLD